MEVESMLNAVKRLKEHIDILEKIIVEHREKVIISKVTFDSV